MTYLATKAMALPQYYNSKIDSPYGTITVELIEGIYNDKNLCQIQVRGPAILEPALQREGYESDELVWVKDIVSDNKVIHEELLLLNNLIIPLNRVADMVVSQLHKATERIKSGDDALSVLNDLIRNVRFEKLDF